MRSVGGRGEESGEESREESGEESGEERREASQIHCELLHLMPDCLRPS